MSRLISRFCLAVALLAFVGHDLAFAQQAPRAGDRARSGAPPSRAPAKPGEPAATPSGAVSRSTQAITPGAPAAPAPAAPKPKEKLDVENTLYLDLDYGRVVIKLFPDLAPQTVARIKELTRQGFYDGLAWHRVLENFMAQTGDPKGDGTGGSGQNIPAEFNSGKHVRGAVSMARASNINSADSQFFIMLGESSQLDGQYTYFGEVVEGMEFVDQIRKGLQQRNGAVPYPDYIVRMQVAADAIKTEGAKPQAGSGKPGAKPAKPL